MKKIIALFLCLSIMAGLMVSSADAVRRRKRVVKKVTIKKVVKKVVKKAAPKVIAPIPAEAIPMPVTPVVEPFIIPVPTVEAAPIISSPVPAPVSAGMGLTAGVKAGLSAGAIALTADLDYSLSKMLPDTKIRVSADFITGKEAAGSNTFRIFNAKVGAIYALPMLKSKDIPVNFYAGGAFILPVVYSSARVGSKWGAEAFMGGSFNAPEIGTIYGELGYAGLKYDSNQPAQKGISANIGLSSSF